MNKNIFKNKNNIILMAVFNAIYTIIIFIAVLYLLFNYVYMIKEVEETSMQPLLNPSGENTDIVYVNRFNVDINYGDIIVLHDNEQDIVKRVVGLPGDSIDIRFDSTTESYKLFRNGEFIDETYLKINAASIDPNGMYTTHLDFVEFKTNNRDKLTLVDNVYTYILGDSDIFLLGDNRATSQDSSEHGAYDIKDILGTVEYIQGEGETNLPIMLNYIFKFKWLNTLFDIFS